MLSFQERSVLDYYIFPFGIVSDIHQGTQVFEKQLTKLVQTIKSQNPDIFLLDGDIPDVELLHFVRII
jgi:hypothetical protein